MLIAAFDPASTGQLACDRFAPGDRQDPLDRCRIGRIAVLRQPPPQGPPGEHRVGGGDGAGVGRIDLGGERVEEVVVGPHQVGGSRR